MIGDQVTEEQLRTFLHPCAGPYNLPILNAVKCLPKSITHCHQGKLSFAPIPSITHASLTFHKRHAKKAVQAFMCGHPCLTPLGAVPPCTCSQLPTTRAPAFPASSHAWHRSGSPCLSPHRSPTTSKAMPAPMPARMPRKLPKWPQQPLTTKQPASNALPQICMTNTCVDVVL